MHLNEQTQPVKIIKAVLLTHPVRRLRKIVAQLGTQRQDSVSVASNGCIYMRLAFEPVEKLKNIGPTVARHLHDLGIRTYADLEQATPAKVYLHLQANHPNRTWPVCYYLYSLEGALRDTHWDKLPQGVKDKLLAQVSG